MAASFGCCAAIAEPATILDPWKPLLPLRCPFTACPLSISDPVTDAVRLVPNTTDEEGGGPATCIIGGGPAALGGGNGLSYCVTFVSGFQ